MTSRSSSLSTGTTGAITGVSAVTAKIPTKVQSNILPSSLHVILYAAQPSFSGGHQHTSERHDGHLDVHLNPTGARGRLLAETLAEISCVNVRKLSVGCCLSDIAHNSLQPKAVILDLCTFVVSPLLYACRTSLHSLKLSAELCYSCCVDEAACSLLSGLQGSFPNVRSLNMFSERWLISKWFPVETVCLRFFALLFGLFRLFLAFIFSVDDSSSVQKPTVYFGPAQAYVVCVCTVNNRAS
ncbi:unnamed protein product [Schistocephalus solidus]|uniref:Uncharacterized protein n=1 Tax=Schistocephalus solidus TaxID=70667 RepID=A0A183SZB1_SCHSO|nr:unnamed protein product [Schistocephalus solidus]